MMNLAMLPFNALIFITGFSTHCAAFSVQPAHDVGTHSFSNTLDSSSIHPYGTNRHGVALHMYSKTTADLEEKQTMEDRQTDIKRLMFQLNQVKEEIVEAELRATAAEQRVISLKMQTEAMESTDNNQSNKLKLMFEEQTASLTEKVREFADALQQLKLDSHKEIMEVQAKATAKEKEFAAEQQKFVSAAAQATSDLEEAKQEIKGFEKDRSEFADEMTRAKLQAHTALVTAQQEGRTTADGLRVDIADLTASLQQANVDFDKVTHEAASLQKNMSELEEQLEKQKLTFQKEVAELEEKAQASAIELETTTRSLQQEIQDAKLLSDKTLESAKLDMTQQLLLAQGISQREKERIVAERDATISEKDSIIAEYEVELGSVRKLTKQSLRLVRARVTSLLRKKEQ